MSERRDEELREALAALKARGDREEMSASEAAVVRRRIDATLAGRSSRRWLIPAMLAPAALAAALALMWPRPPPSPFVTASRCVDLVGDAVLVPSSCGPASVTLGADRLTLEPGTDLVRSGGGVKLVRGRARFEVERRSTSASRFTVAVSHGTIEVMGTVFDVDQGEGRGALRLASGRVRFLWADGAPPTELAPGDLLTWPRAAEAIEEPVEEPVADPAPRRGRAREAEPLAPGLDVDEVLKRMFLLRSQRRYDEAAEWLARHSARKDLGLEQRARLSYEHGLIIAEHLGDAEAACAHWRRHARTFAGAKARRREVQQALEACR